MALCWLHGTLWLLLRKSLIPLISLIRQERVWRYLLLIAHERIVIDLPVHLWLSWSTKRRSCWDLCICLHVFVPEAILTIVLAEHRLRLWRRILHLMAIHERLWLGIWCLRHEVLLCLGHIHLKGTLCLRICCHSLDLCGWARVWNRILMGYLTCLDEWAWLDIVCWR